jgi:enoyl-CoA hydratase/carnithine racemase
MKADDPVVLSIDEHGVATITLNRPERRNAFNVEMIDRWHERLKSALADPKVLVIVLTGAGKAFCAGGDLDEVIKFRTQDSLARKNFLWEHVHKIAFALERADKPVIAAVNGVASGAGCDMALMCDLRIVARSAVFSESYIRLGLIAGDAGTYFLPRLIGSVRALELFWTGREVRSDEAERIGLVNRVVDDADLLPATYQLARQIASQSPQAVRLFKRAVYQSQTLPLATHLDMVSSHMAVLEDTAEHHAALDALIARMRGG